ncbi:MAG: restriction endonuclease subunit S, partial [Ethanoligenens sp.]
MDTKSLRQKILDLAIRGKLVPQDPNDEPASVLLERIRIEKQQMVKDGKLKAKDIKGDTVIFKGEDNLHYEKMSDGTVKCIENEIPFEVPEGWSWARLGFLAFYKKGPFGSSITKAMFVPDSAEAIKVYEQKNAIYKDESLGNYYITPGKFQELKGFEVFPDDIIVSCAGTIGESFVMPSTMRQGVINQALMRIMLYDKNIIDFYLVYFDFVLKSESNDKGKGTAIKNIPPFDVLKQFFMPIPPLPEQMRILQVINQLTACVSCIDDAKHEIASLIAQAKSKILDLAIRGKLVPRDPADEPASVLLERIRAEKEQLIRVGKIKRDKNESYIFRGDDKSYYERIGAKSTNIDVAVPYQIPTGWQWSRNKSVYLNNLGGGTPSKSVPEYWNGDISWASVKDIADGMVYLNSTKDSISQEGLDNSPSNMVEQGNIIVCTRISLDRIVIANIDVAINQDLRGIILPDQIDKLYYV